MALPNVGKYVVPLLVVALVYTGYAFRVRDANPSLVSGDSAEVVRGGCHSPSGKCPEKTSSWTPSTPTRGRFETASARGRIAKIDKPPADLEDHAVNRKQRKSPLKTWTFSVKSRLKSDDGDRELLSDEESESPDFKDEDEDEDDYDGDDRSKGGSDEMVKIENEEDEGIDSELEEESKSEEDDETEVIKRKEEERKKQEEENERRKAELKRKKEEEEKQKKRDEELKRNKENEERERKEREEARKRKEEEERRQREVEKRRRKEEDERRQKEEEERKRREEEERKRREEEERKRREEEERKRREEDERRRKEETERRQKEEEERKRRKEEERKQKEEEGRKRKEEEQRRQEEERQRIAEEERIKREEERRKTEEDERRKREEEKRKNEEERKRKDEEARMRKEIELDEQRRAKQEGEKRKQKEKEEERKRKEKKSVEVDDEVSEEIPVKLPSLPRKLEKVRLADKEKHMSIEVLREKFDIRKQFSKKLDVKAVLDKTNEDTKPSTTRTREIKPTDTSSKLGHIRIDEPKLTPKSEKSAAKSPTHEKSMNQVSKEEEKTKASKPRSKKGAEAYLSLTELNDAILHVPTFVPNFTAVENGACQQHGKIFLRQLRGYKLWALQMLDSSAKIPSSLLRGNVNQLGDFDQCLGVMARVKIDEKTIKIQGKYCLATVDIHATRQDMKVPVNLMKSRGFIRGNMRDPGHFAPRFTTINWALCLPSACSADDARKSFENALEIFNVTSGIRLNVDVDPDSCYIKQKTQNYSKETIGVLYFYAMIICLVLVASFRDYFVTVQERGNYSERIIMSFSLKRTLKALFADKVGAGDIGCIHGLRSISTIALYIAHKLIPVSRMPYANRVTITEVANNPISMIFRASLFYTDSFLLLSGVLTAYNMAKELSIRGEIRWFCRFIARFIRLTPALLAIIFWYAFVMEHTGSGPQWNTVIKANADICKANAWINLLYVQNFFPFEEMCATHTHQLALDMQLSILAPLLVFFIQVKPVIGIIVAFFLLQVSATLRYLATTGNNLSLVIFHGMTLKHLYKTANLTYILPLHRATPYIFGIGLGVILHHTGKNIKLHKIFVIIGWLTTAALATWSIFSPWRLARRDYTYNVEEATQYAVISPVSSALALSWVIFACFTDNGGFVNKILSSYWMLIFSRISYSVYLSQFAVFFYNVGTTRYSSEFQIHRAIDPFEVTTVIAVSVVMTLLFDIPMQEFKNILMESSDILTVQEATATESSDQNDHIDRIKDPDRRFHNGVTPDSEESYTGNWNWDRGSFKPDSREFDYEEAMRSSKINRQDPRRQSLNRPDVYENWDRSNYNRSSSEQGHYFTNVRSRSAQRINPEDIQRDEQYIHRPRYAASEYSRSPMREIDPVRHRSASRERPINREKDQTPLWEFAGRDRSLSRPTETRAPLLIVSNEDDQITRSPRASVPRFTEQQKTGLSETEADNIFSRVKKYDKRPVDEPRISDEDDWEDDLRIRRRRMLEDKYTSQERERVPVVEENNEWDSLRRRSSAEGKIALLKEPVTARNMEFWTVSKMQLGSSQEPDDDDEDSYLRQRRERGSFEDEPGIEEEQGGNSYASESIPTSFEDEEEDVENFDFVLRKDSKRITVQDLSKIDQEDEATVDQSDTTASEEKDQVPMSGLSVSSGLIKRESIVKSQASEEDPEYLIPERPKLIEQEQEHPFKKAWQIQKSRSEEDGTPVFVVRDMKIPEKKKDADDSDKKVTEGGQSQVIDNHTDYTLEPIVWQSRSTDKEDPKSSSKSDASESDDKTRFSWPEDEEQLSRHLEEETSEAACWGLGDGET